MVKPRLADMAHVAEIVEYVDELLTREAETTMDIYRTDRDRESN